MIRKDLLKNISSVAEATGLTDEQVLEAITQGLISGCKRTHKVNSCRVEFKEDKNELLVYKQYLVVDDYDLTADKTYTQLLLEDAKAEKARVKVGDILEIKVNPEEYGHYAIRDMKQKYNEIVVNYQKSNLLGFFKDKENEMLRARVIDASPTTYRIDLGKETTLLPKTETLDKDNLHIGDDIYVYVSSVEMKPKGPKIYVTRKHPGLVMKLMEKHIPEIAEGVVEIVGISRDAGDRSKVGVRTNNPQVDPIGACVGEGGSRIREVVAALSGEKIDLFRWSDNERELIENALQPADVVAVTKVNPREKTALAIVPNDQLSLAIGKQGQNVKLAVQASGWSIDIKSEAMAAGEGILY
ncbi:transcription termination factor NusA [Haploplasma axanthum]|uniref:Transcription termination/antitermination protein NusA n=1 Tax=Haploplasma axanthum TaxID=29552 RepID=A0A449BDG7_HAPAX|nr:transcription termination factor NusA [Haploplasma axanthum]VEU80501.1 Transcription elongation protein nusA [Haploplasma axanthum]